MTDKNIERLQREANEGLFIRQHKEVYDRISNTLTEDILNTVHSVDTTDRRLCSDIIQRIQIVKAYAGRIQEILDTGKMADIELQTISEQQNPTHRRIQR